MTGEEPVKRRIRKQRDDLAVEAENPEVEKAPVEEASPVKAGEPLPQVAELERKSLEQGCFVVESAEPVLEFRRVVNHAKSIGYRAGRSV